MNSTPPIRRRIWLLRQLPAVVLQAFTLTFLAEWGDRSQFATIILAAREVCYFNLFDHMQVGGGGVTIHLNTYNMLGHNMQCTIFTFDINVIYSILKIMQQYKSAGVHLLNTLH